MNKKGFTLAEVLITLGILGFIAVMLLPTIQKITPSTEKLLFKRSYTTLAKVVSSLINDDMHYPADETDTYESSAIEVQEGFHFIDTNGVTVPANTNKFCYLFADSLNTVGTVSCTETVGAEDTGTFKTTDGANWWIYTPATQFRLNNTVYETLITMDINGTGKGHDCSFVAFSNPTTTACATNVIPDIYQVGVRFDGKLRLHPDDDAAIEILSDPTDNSR
jgi:prepilin-type N-terminal cleavage/methylation domain-containing protein